MQSIHERWNETDDTLETTITSTDFMSVIDLVLRISEIAEEQNHHPDLLIHGYKNLTITLTTHDSEGVTEKDYALAQAIDELLAE